MSSVDQAYDKAFKHLISIEGVIYTDHPNDNGGPSKFGLSQRFLTNYFNRPFSEDEIRQLTLEDAYQIYRYEFWDSMELSRLPEGIALCLFDQAVHSGVSSSVQSVQKILGLRQDGIMGPITRGVIISQATKRLCFDFLAERLRRYGKLVAGDKSQAVWLSGWQNRIMALVEKTLL